MTAPASPGERQLAAQTGLTIVAKESLDAATAQLDINDLQASTPQFTKLVQAVVAQYGRLSAALAATHYRSERRDAGVRGAYRPTLADAPGFQPVQSTVEWAITPLYSAEPDTAAFDRQLSLGVGKLVQDTGRVTVISNVHHDRQANGWARIPEPSESKSGTCAFCALLASRGATYRSKRQADFRAHDGCHCHPEPLFGYYRPSEQVKEWQDLYKSATSGRHGKDALAAFRQAIEGRPVTGLTKGPNKPAIPKLAQLPPEHAARLITQLEAANGRAAGNPLLAQMVAANAKRIKALRAA